MDTPPFWTLSADQALKQVESQEGGLSAAEAAARLRRWGPNELAPPRRLEAIREIARYVANPLVIILLLASGISAAFGQVASSVIVALMLILSVTLNFTQAYRSQKAAERLRRQVGQTATVLRDGSYREIPTREVVRGDVVQLKAGDLVPADCRLLVTKDLFVNEAALTGESLPREKHVQAEPVEGEGPGRALTAVFRGTSVISGLGVAVAMPAAHGRDVPGTGGDREALVLPTVPDVNAGTSCSPSRWLMAFAQHTDTDTVGPPPPGRRITELREVH